MSTRNVSSVLMAEPAVNPDGTLKPWLGQALQRAFNYIGPSSAGSSALSLTEQVLQLQNSMSQNFTFTSAAFLAMVAANPGVMVEALTLDIEANAFPTSNPTSGPWINGDYLCIGSVT